MSNFTATSIDTSDVAWPEPIAIAPERIIHGSPVASTFVLDDSPARQLGLWRVTEGSFTTDHVGYLEYIHILSGRGTLTDDDGAETLLAPGVTVLMQPGWKGRWTVDETITKVFTVIHS